MRIGSERVHLVGVGGAGMSALGRLLHGAGCDLTGSDVTDGPVVRALKAEGLRVWVGHRPERVHGEGGYVVRSAAVPLDDAEVRECDRRGFTALLYADAVGRVSEGKRTLAVAGTHGKTTTTGLTVAALRGAGLDPSHLIGGEVPELGGNGHGGRDDVLVVEACEFNRSFHNLRPYCGAVLNLDDDHFDCYPSNAALVEAFAAYAARIRPGGTLFVEETVPPPVVDAVGGDVRVLRVGSGLFADVRAVEVTDDTGRYSFVPVVDGARFPRVRLALSGRFQMHNALFALAMSLAVGADPEGCCRGLSEFAGVRRRFELHRGVHGGLLVNDYAHHPAEIKAVIRAARRRFPCQRLIAVFQPHQYRRTLHLLDGFADALSQADLCLVAEIYGARESGEITAAVSSSDLVSGLRDRGAVCEGEFRIDEVPPRLADVREDDDVVLILGAGDIDTVVERVLEQI